LAINKVLAARDRREPRDAVDLVTIHDRILPLGPLIWAACDVSPGWTPESFLSELRRTTAYRKAEYEQLAFTEPVDPGTVATRLREILADAETFILRMPTEKVGVLFLKDGMPVQPDPGRLGDYVEHRAQRRGHWPTSPEISRAMLEQHVKKKP
jgi:hypothetical protein